MSQLMDELRSKTDNPKKLRESSAVERHLFVWVNDVTERGIARPVSNGDALGQRDWWGLPDTVPELDPAITDLWVVHARSRSGWRWNGRKWSAVEFAKREFE